MCVPKNGGIEMKIKNVLKNMTLVAFAVCVSLMVFKGADAASPVSGGRAVCPYFTIEGEEFYCVEHDKTAPNSKVIYSQKKDYNNDQIAKIIVNRSLGKGSRQATAFAIWHVTSGIDYSAQVEACGIGKDYKALLEDVDLNKYNVKLYIVTTTAKDADGKAYQQLVGGECSEKPAPTPVTTTEPPVTTETPAPKQEEEVVEESKHERKESHWEIPEETPDVEQEESTTTVTTAPQSDEEEVPKATPTAVVTETPVVTKTPDNDEEYTVSDKDSTPSPDTEKVSNPSPDDTYIAQTGMDPITIAVPTVIVIGLVAFVVLKKKKN